MFLNFPWKKTIKNRKNTQNLSPILHVIGSLKEYREELIGKKWNLCGSLAWWAVLLKK